MQQSISIPSDSGRLIVVDDEPVLVEKFAARLRLDGFHCEIAKDGEEALKIIHAAHPPFDAVLTDIFMPKMDGLSLARKLAHQSYSIPVVLITGRPEVSTAIDSVQLRIFAYVTKPANMDELSITMRKAAEFGRQIRGLQEMHQSLRCWGEDLQRIEIAMRDRRDPSNQITEYLNLLVENLQATISNLVEVGEMVKRTGGQSDQESLLQALKETIGVLEKTRTSFRSRTLGELRVKLSRIVMEEEGNG